MIAAKRWLATPLAGTAGVMAGLCLLAFPLRKLTSAVPVAAVVVKGEDVSAEETMPAVLRLKLLAPAKGVMVKTTNEQFLLGPVDLDAGESEYDVILPFKGKDLELSMTAEFIDPSADSAVFLTVMPDGFEDQTRFVIGRGLVSESMAYEWHVREH